MNNATSYSDIDTYQRCPKKYQYRAVWKIQRKKQSLNLFRGIAAHEMLKDFYLRIQAGLPRSEALEAVLDYFTNEVETGQYLFEEELVNARMELKLMYDLVLRFLDQEDFSGYEILHVEEEFYAVLDNGEVVSFTPDLVIRDANGDIWIIDHKTTSQLPDGKLPFGNLQAMFYIAGVKALYGDAVKGFIFSRMRKKAPTQPRLNKTGAKKVNDLLRVDTTYEMLRDFIRTEAPELLDDPVHRRRLAELKDSDRFFWTETVYSSDELVEGITQDILLTTEHMRLSRELNGYERNMREDNSYNACKKCPFVTLCQGELLGWDVEQILEESFEPRAPKNPYETEEE